MLQIVMRRALIALVLVMIVTSGIFLMVHIAAGNTVPGLGNDSNITPAELAQIRKNLGLDRPLYVQYLDWLGVAYVMHGLGLSALLGGGSNITPGLIEGDFGRSLLTGQPVFRQIAVALPATILLSITALLVGLVLAVPLGVIAAVKRGTVLDHTLTVLSVGGFAIPQFWLGLVLIMAFAVGLHRLGLPHLPSGGEVTAVGGGDILDRIAHLIMPTTVLSSLYVSIWTRFVRTSMLEVMSQDYIRTARAKGMSERRVLYVHALRNAITPLITLVGLELPRLVSGALIVEVVFQWPGIGLLTYNSAANFDYPSVLGTSTFVASMVVVGNLIADLLYSAVDPRLRSG